MPFTTGSSDCPSSRECLSLCRWGPQEEDTQKYKRRQKLYLSDRVRLCYEQGKAASHGGPENGVLVLGVYRLHFCAHLAHACAD